MVTHLRLIIAHLKHHRFGTLSERGGKRLEQLELPLVELEAAVRAVAGVATASEGATKHNFARRKAVRAPLPAHIYRVNAS